MRLWYKPRYRAIPKSFLATTRQRERLPDEPACRGARTDRSSSGCPRGPTALDEVDRLARSEPEGRGGVAKVVNARGVTGVLEGVVVIATADVVAIQQAAFGTEEDSLLEAGSARLGGSMFPE